ncbi:hypothetical protein ACL03H_12515 [Saccharopolyspora sp. MS10]|uniref:hypothetical protein n=1 Tax=Saccharopolyspora sp. MS10 TaxID=3385973 RepID=UPI00399FA6FC
MLKATTAARSESRERGRIEERATGFRVVVYAGVDPVTGKRVYLRETIKGTNDAARKRAEKALTKLLNQVNEQNSAPSTVALTVTQRFRHTIRIPKDIDLSFTRARCVISRKPNWHSKPHRRP